MDFCFSWKENTRYAEYYATRRNLKPISAFSDIADMADGADIADGADDTAALPALPHLLFADCSDEFLKVERFEVRYILEVACTVCGEGRGEH